MASFVALKSIPKFSVPSLSSILRGDALEQVIFCIFSFTVSCAIFELSQVLMTPFNPSLQ
ncbi:hypothetical protein IC611_00545 [Proteus mirabilis]